ncbi:PREDICTED: EF-hand domain-containing protein D2 [Nipponia nippon]|nr:PREDICTED: EF-hand domain-containing protein D2 [Nipponia nippon]
MPVRLYVPRGPSRVCQRRSPQGRGGKASVGGRRVRSVPGRAACDRARRSATLRAEPPAGKLAASVERWKFPGGDRNWGGLLPRSRQDAREEPGASGTARSIPAEPAARWALCAGSMEATRLREARRRRRRRHGCGVPLPLALAGTGVLCGLAWDPVSPSRRYDAGKDGFIDLMELKLMMEKLGAPQTHLGLKNMIKEVDEDLDSKLSFREFLVIFRKAAAGELQEDSGLHALARLSEIDVSTEGVKGAKSFFEAKVQAIHDASRFEEEIKAEQEEKKKQAEELKQRKAAFKELQSAFKQ